MTLDAVEVDLANCFEAGHAYVALSRAVSLHATRLISFDASRVFAHPAVAAYYAHLEGSSRGAGSAAAGSAAAAPSPPPVTVLSDEQRARIEASKARALAKRALTGARP